LKEKEDDVLNKDKTMDNFRKRNICTDVPSSQNFTPYLRSRLTSELLSTVGATVKQFLEKHKHGRQKINLTSSLGIV
jgi:hypothetical protein